MLAVLPGPLPSAEVEKMGEKYPPNPFGPGTGSPGELPASPGQANKEYKGIGAPENLEPILCGVEMLVAFL